MIGQTVKHYEVEGLLGQGGMGVVYRARDPRLGRPVALKFLPAEATADPDRKRRFLQEARAACAVNHPAIAQIYDVDESDRGVFIAMELVEGKTVRTLIKGRELDLLAALDVAMQVASGLGKAHEAGIVHRDIKPENVIVTPDGHAKILDFGLAKLLESPDSGASGPPGGDELSHMETIARTQAGMVVGTLRYMSPEQARGQAVDYRSDLFSLGIVLYEMVTGQLPFAGATPLDTLHAIAFEETQPVTAIRPNIPASLQRVVTRCLRKRAQDRYPDARELIADLKAVRREVESGASQPGAGLRLRLEEQLQSLRALGPRAAWVLGSLALLSLLAVFVLLAGRWSWPSTFALVGAGLLTWRRIRNRRSRFLRSFTSRVRRLPEVRAVSAEGQRITVVTDTAVAAVYVRVATALDAVNGKMFFGDPFQAVVRDDMTADEVKALLRSPGVLFVRDEKRRED